MERETRYKRILEQKYWELEVETTTLCRRHCYDCNHLCSEYLAPASYVMSPEWLSSFLSQSSIVWDKIVLLGGEPALHPHLDLLLYILAEYRDKVNPRCVIGISSADEEKMNKWVDTIHRIGTISLQEKPRSSRYVDEFVPMTIAPCDLGLPVTADCGWPCGLGLSVNGLYRCGPGSAIDRVVNSGTAILPPEWRITRDALERQVSALCSLCGFHVESTGRKLKKLLAEQGIHTPIITPTWVRLLDTYRRIP